MNNSNLSSTNNKAARGSISQILLSALLSGDKYGYEICKDIEQRTNGKLILKQPSLYSSLRRMEEQDLIKSYWGDSDIGGRRHYYSITEKGRQKYDKHKNDWESFDALIDSLPSSFNNEPVKKYQSESKSTSENIENANKTLILNQENLFNTNNSQNKAQIKKIEEDDNSSSFFQFDLFNESASIINKKTIKETPTFETFTNKFVTEENIEDTFEPVETDSFDISDDEIKKQVQETFQKVLEEDKNTIIENTVSEEKEEKLYNDAHILSDNEKGQQSIDLDDFMKANFGFSSNEYKKESNKENKEKEKISINFVSLLDETNKQSDFKEENFEITKPYERPNFENFPEVLKDDQRISEEQVALTNGIIMQPIGVAENSNTSEEQTSLPTVELANEIQNTYDNDDKTDSLEYQNVLGKLYSNTNRNDPYEISKLKKFGRLPEDEETTLDKDIEIANDLNIVSEEPLNDEQQNNTFIKITKNDLIQEFKNEGVKLKEYKKLSKHTKKGNYINYYKLKIFNAWILWLLMFVEIGVTYFVVKNNNLLGVNHDNFYLWSLGIVSAYPVYYTLTYLFNKEKKIESNFKINISIFNKFLAMLIAIVFIFSINLFIGMTSLNQIAYLSYWLLPTILSTNFVVSSIIYFILLKTKKFYV